MFLACLIASAATKPWNVNQNCLIKVSFKHRNDSDYDMQVIDAEVPKCRLKTPFIQDMSTWNCFISRCDRQGWVQVLYEIKADSIWAHYLSYKMLKTEADV